MYRYAHKNVRPFSAVCQNNYGRQVIFTRKRQITKNNIIEELNKALVIHEQNAIEIEYLDRYYRGDQPILYRQKVNRPEINNKIAVNLAYELVERKTAEMCAEPIQYVLRGTDNHKSEEITRLNITMDSESKQECDIDIHRWRMEAWMLVSKALRNGYYGAVEEFNKLPPLVQKAVGSPDNLRNWALTDINSIENVVQSNFMRTYRTVVNRAKEYQKMPKDIKALIESANKSSYSAQIGSKNQQTIKLSLEDNKSQNKPIKGIPMPKEIKERIEQMKR